MVTRVAVEIDIIKSLSRYEHMQPLHVLGRGQLHWGEGQVEPRVGYGGCRSLVWGSKGDDIYIYRLFVKFVVPTAGSDKRNPRWQAGVGVR